MYDLSTDTAVGAFKGERMVAVCYSHGAGEDRIAFAKFDGTVRTPLPPLCARTRLRDPCTSRVPRHVDETRVVGINCILTRCLWCMHAGGGVRWTRRGRRLALGGPGEDADRVRSQGLLRRVSAVLPHVPVMCAASSCGWLGLLACHVSGTRRTGRCWCVAPPTVPFTCLVTYVHDVGAPA